MIVNIWCDDDLDICREFHEFKLQPEMGRSRIRDRLTRPNLLVRASRYVQQLDSEVLSLEIESGVILSSMKNFTSLMRKQRRIDNCYCQD